MKEKYKMQEIKLTDEQKLEGTQIGIYFPGLSDEDSLNDSIYKSWKESIRSPNEKKQICELLGIKEDELDLNTVPFRAEITKSGLTGGEVMIAVATGFVLGAAKETGALTGKEAVKRLKKLWTDHVQARVSPVGSGKLGATKDESKNDLDHK